MNEPSRSPLSTRIAIGRRLAHKVLETYRSKGVWAVLVGAAHKLRWIVHELSFHPYQIKKRFGGNEYSLLISDLFAKGWYDYPRPWPELDWVSEHLLRPGDHAVDCGANIGFTSLVFAHCVGATGKVTAIEALPRNAEVARVNVVLNDCSNVEVLNVAAGSHAGVVDFLAYPNGAVGSRPDMKTVKVSVDTLDSLLNGQRVDFIKIDVEAYEVEVLKGATKILESAPALDIEIHCSLLENPKAAFKDILQIIQASRYLLWIQEQVDGEICPVRLDELDLDRVSRLEVVHLFCHPRRSALRTSQASREQQ